MQRRVSSSGGKLGNDFWVMKSRRPQVRGDDRMRPAGRKMNKQCLRVQDTVTVEGPVLAEWDLDVGVKRSAWEYGRGRTS